VLTSFADFNSIAEQGKDLKILADFDPDDCKERQVGEQIIIFMPNCEEYWIWRQKKP
jgi:hypothetical protein